MAAASPEVSASTFAGDIFFADSFSAFLGSPG
jgi:hypothetical protein